MSNQSPQLVRNKPLLQITVDQETYDEIVKFKEKDRRPTMSNAADYILSKGIEYIKITQKAA